MKRAKVIFSFVTVSSLIWGLVPTGLAQVAGTTPSAPSAPSGLTISLSASGVDVNVSWTDTSSNESEFKIFRRISGGTWAERAMVSTNIVTYTDISVPAGTYEYHVNACNSSGCSADSNIATVTIGGVSVSPSPSPTASPSPSPAPSGTATVTGKVIDANGVSVANASISVYKIDYSSSYGGSSDASGLYKVLNIPGGTYKINVSPPYGTTGFTSPPPADIILSEGQILTKDLILVSALKTIKGTVKRFDGKAVTNASVNAYRKDTQSSVQAQTDATGVYTLLVSGGSWEVSVYPATTPADWSLNQPPQTVIFTDTATAEEKILDFTVSTTDSTIKGKILKPDGTALLQGAASINFQKSDGAGFGTGTDAAGAFAVSVSAGTYNVFINVNDQLYNAPSVPAVTVVSGETKDLGTITLVKATKTIKGTVKRPDGTAVTDAGVNAWRKDTSTSVQAQTDTAGNYTLLLSGGSWEVSVYPRTQPADWSYNQPPQFASFLADASAEIKTLDFIVTTTDATVMGKVLKPDGTAPAANSVFINFQKSDGPGFGTPVESTGAFTAKLASGSYSVFIQANDPLFNAPSVPAFTIASGQTLDLGTITLIKATKTIKGTVKRPDGKVITDAGVNSWRRDTQSSAQTQTDAQGNYTLAVTGGYWEVSVYPRTGSAEWSYNQPPLSVVFADDTKAEEKIIDFIVTATDASVKGKIVKPDGTYLSPNTVFINFQREGSGFGAPLDATGAFSVKVAKGTYYVFLQVNDPLYNAPAIPSFTILSGETKDLGIITLVKATKTIKGKVTRADGKAVTDAMVNAMKITSAATPGSYPGGGTPQAGPPTSFASAQTDASGNYTLLMTGGAWEVNIFPAGKTTSDWLYNQPPQPVIFADNTTPEEKIINFTVVTADATAIGKVLKPDGKVPSQNTVFINFQSREGLGAGAPLDINGAFRVALPAGTYQVSIWSQDQTLVPPALAYVTIAKGETKDLGTITLVTATKVIKGKITREDGRAVTDAEVGAFRKDTQTWVGVKPDSTGNYSLLVAGGSWDVTVHPVSNTPDWSYAKPPTAIIFSADPTPEEKTVNFTVVSTDAAVVGKVLKPDGTAPLPNTVFIGLGSATGFGAGGPVDSSGAFRIAVAAGTYNVFIHSQDQTFATPEIPPITVGTGETKDLGTIKLVSRQDRITGKVTDKDGKALGGIAVEAFQPQGSAFTSAKTDALGLYTLAVTPGDWSVMARPDPLLNLYNPDPAKRVTVTSGVVATANFTLLAADATISGIVTDVLGNTLTDVYGWAELSRPSTASPLGTPGEFGNFTPGFGVSMERGSFTIKAPAGTYTLSIFLPPDSSYTGGPPQTVTAVSSGVTNIKVVVLKNASVITGTLKDETGKVVTNIDVRVFATTRTGAWQEAAADRATGKYTLRVAAGAWLVRYEVAPGFGYGSFSGPDLSVTVKEGETVTKDLTLKKAGSTITGKVTDPTGKAVLHAFVGISNTSFKTVVQGVELKDPIVAGAETDANGAYKIAVPAGEYFLRVFVRPELGYINAEEQRVQALDGQTLTLDLKLRKADLFISGKVLADDLLISEAFIWASSEKGGYQESFSKPDGSYQLNVSGSDVWRVAAGKDIKGEFYKADEAAVLVATSSVVQNITLRKFAVLAASASQTRPARETTVVSVKDGATVVVPANAVATGDSVTITVTPDVRTPSQGEVKVVGVAYDIQASTATGTVSTLNTKVTVTIPYDEAELTKLGVLEKNLVVSFWDETVGTWKPVENSVVNTQENIVTSLVDHLTRFAIVAAADVTPPQPPTDITATALGGGKIKLTWKDPAKDFRYAKVYRGAKVGELGTVIAPEAVAGEVTDNDIVDGLTYYYTVRAVDPAGNESKNIDQVSVKAIGTSVKGVSPKVEVKKEAAAPAYKAPTPPAVVETITRLLRVGHKGEDVKLLQGLLIKEKVYRGKVTGYFGSGTRTGVRRFQEKYRAEILVPQKRKTGTGAVDEATLKKINELLSGSASSPAPKKVSYELKRTLSLGSAGDDVKVLQWLLNGEGVYPEGIINGIFSDATRQAVRRFQEKYAPDILASVGLRRGSGIVGSETRKKLNELFGR